MSLFGIEIAGEFLEIPQEVGIAFDIAGNDFSELNTRQGVNSNDFNIPATTKNKRLLSGSGRIDSKLYLKNRVISSGFLQIVERNYEAKVIKAAYFGGNSDWLSFIDNKELRELDFLQFDHNYNLTNILAGLTSTVNYCYPLINYGNLTQAANNEVDINNQDLRPALFAPAILRQIFKDAGIKVSGNLFNTLEFNKALLPWTGADDSQPSQTLTRLTATKADQALVNIAGYINGILLQSTVTEGNISYFNTSGGRFLNRSAYGSIKVDYSYDITVVGLTSSLDIRRTVQDSTSGVLISSNVIVSTVANGNFTGSESGVEIPEGAEIVFEYQNGNLGTETTSEIVFTCDNTKMVIANTLPEISQKDFVRWVVASFGCLLDYNDKTKTLNFNLSNQLYSGLNNALDWTPKIDLSKDRKENFVDFIKDYAQTNIFKYGSADNQPDGRGSFLVSDDTLPGSQDYYSAPFNGTAFATAFLGSYSTAVSLPFLDIIDEDGDISATDPRVLSSSPEGARISLDITDGTTTTAVTDYNIPEFSPLSYALLVPEFYRDISQIINNKSSFEVYIRLSSSDIEKFNQENIVRIEARYIIGYFYVSKIEDFNAEDLSYEVTLLKL